MSRQTFGYRIDAQERDPKHERGLAVFSCSGSGAVSVNIRQARWFATQFENLALAMERGSSRPQKGHEASDDSHD